MDHDVERFEIRMRPAFKAKLVEVANQEGVSVGEMIIRAACRAIGYAEEDAVAPRKLPGRKPVIPSIAPTAVATSKRPGARKRKRE